MMAVYASALKIPLTTEHPLSVATANASNNKLIFFMVDYVKIYDKISIQ